MEDILPLEIYEFIDEFIPIDIFMGTIRGLIGVEELALKKAEILQEIEEADEFLDYLSEDNYYDGTVEHFSSGEILLEYDGISILLSRIFYYEFIGGEWEYNDTEYVERIYIWCKHCGTRLGCTVHNWYSCSTYIDNCDTCRKRNTWLMISKRIGLDRHVSRDISKFI